MLSLLGTFRGAARSCRLPAPATTRTLASRTANHLENVEPQSISDLSDKFNAAAAEQELAQMQADIDQQDVIIDPSAIKTSKGFPVLKGFRINRFIKPKQFTYAEYNKDRAYRKRPFLGPDASTSRQLDLFHQQGFDPLRECQNSTLMSEYVTSMGKIKGRSETNLTWRNQRRMGKAIRRAKMMGIIPVLSRRPLLQTDLDKQG